jgi:hypothetical protein
VIRLAIDAMGGDDAPGVVVDGAVAAARHLDARLALVGPIPVIERALSKHADWRALGIETVEWACAGRLRRRGGCDRVRWLHRQRRAERSGDDSSSHQ